MRSSAYVFLVFAAVCAGVEYWGVNANLFSVPASLGVAVCFVVAAFITLSNAFHAYSSTH